MLWKNLPKSFLALAPMADMTDSPFSRIVSEIGGVDVIFREMVSAEAIVRENQKTIHMTEIHESERPVVQQIFGSNPESMAKAASIIMDRAHPDGIDINMGCPVYKITHNFNGAALMKDSDLAKSIVKAVVSAVDPVPVSVKIRLGWDNPDTYMDFIRMLESAGASAVTVHGRTKTQAYGGKSDWKRIGNAVSLVSIPVIANGDVHDPKQVPECFSITGAKGIAIARGALGNPWFFKRAKTKRYEPVSLRERCEIVLRHAELHMEFYGVSNLMTFRKHLVWYFKGVKSTGVGSSPKEFRMRLVRVTTLKELRGLFESHLSSERGLV